VCTLANPTVIVSPTQSQWMNSGASANFVVTVTDRDSTNCGQSTLNLSGGLPSGWSGVWNTNALTLSPGQSGQAILTVTSPAGTPDGFNNIGITATNSTSQTYSASQTATFVVHTVTTTVSVMTDSPTYSGTQNVTINVTVLANSSPASGIAVS